MTADSGIFLASARNLNRQRPTLIYGGLKENISGWQESAHSHDFTELLFVREGSGLVKIDEITYPIKKGNLVIYNKNTLHTEFFDDSPRKEFIFVGLGNLRLSGLAPNELINKPFLIIPTASYYETVNHYLTEILRESESGEPFSDIILQHLTHTLMLLTLRISAFDISLTFAKNTAYIEAKEYFDRNFTADINLDSVCKNLFINKFYLTHLFKSELGVPPIKYLILKRVAYAKTLLSTTEDNVVDIARACGYSDPAYFCRVFKNAEDCTPLQFRFKVKKQKADTK